MVGAGAVLSYNSHVATGEIALGVPAKSRPNKSFSAEQIATIVDSYVRRGARFREEYS